MNKIPHLQIEKFPRENAVQLIKMALQEDIAGGDVTTEWSIPQDEMITARLIAKENGIVSGLQIIELIFEEFGSKPEIILHCQDGQVVKNQDIIAEIRGSARAILSTERTLLNFLQRLSGISTQTNAFTEIVKGTTTRILDTRKTLPGYRLLDKWAVKMGGGTNHRIGLYDMFMAKDNHLAACGGISGFLEKIKKNPPEKVMVEIEVETLDQLKMVLNEGGVDVVMLDNMNLEVMKEAIGMIKKGNHSIKTEASGNMDLEKVMSLKNTGLDFISIGALTHSVKAFDISMRF